jgi:hypothetical protein
MKKKKLTIKGQKETLERNELYRIIRLVAYGATGGDDLTNVDYMFCVEQLSRLLPALKQVFKIGDTYETKNYLLFDCNMHKYETLDTISDFYFEAGLRAANSTR